MRIAVIGTGYGGLRCIGFGRRAAPKIVPDVPRHNGLARSLCAACESPAGRHGR